MSNRHKVFWSLFPVLSLLSWITIVGLFTKTLPNNLSFLVLLAIPFYMGAIMFTIPLNIFTIIALLKGHKTKLKKKQKHKTYYVVGYLNLLVSMLWAFTTFKLGWILTA